MNAYMQEQKPRLLEVVKNNMGAETRVHYAPSTNFYIADREAGNKYGNKIEIITIHPIKEGQKEKRISSGRWMKL